MQRATIKEYGGPEKLTVEAGGRPPEPRAGQMLVLVEAAGVNFIDIMQREGVIKLPLPCTLGLEGVGRVRAVGADVDRMLVRKRVAWINVIGSYASELLVLAAEAVLVPDTLSTNEALLLQAITAQYLVTEYRAVRPGDRVLVHSAAGGVGRLLVQWLKHLGAWVVGTASTEAKAHSVRLNGADAAISYGSDYTFLEELRALSGGRGVDLAFDAVGACTLTNTLKALARGGTVVSYGSASGPPPAINPLELVGPCTRVAGESVFSYVAEPGELQERASAVLDGIGADWLRLGEGTAYELRRVADAHRNVQGRATQGKLYLTP